MVSHGGLNVISDAFVLDKKTQKARFSEASAPVFGGTGVTHSAAVCESLLLLCI